jgi:DNA-binding transcriptional ArsR family regulator
MVQSNVNGEEKIRDSKNSVYHRAKILSLIKKEGRSLKISELASLMEVSRPTIYAHLDTLEKRGLVILTKTEKSSKIKGAPVFVSLTDKADPINLEDLNKAHDTWNKLTSIFR